MGELPQDVREHGPRAARRAGCPVRGGVALRRGRHGPHAHRPGAPPLKYPAAPHQGDVHVRSSAPRAWATRRRRARERATSSRSRPSPLGGPAFAVRSRARPRKGPFFPHRGAPGAARLTLESHGYVPKDGIWIGGPDEGFRLGIAVLDEAVDRRLEVDDRWNVPRVSRRRVSRRRRSRRRSARARDRGEVEAEPRMAAEPAQHLWVLCGWRSREETWISLPAGTARSMARNRMNSSCR